MKIMPPVTMDCCYTRIYDCRRVCELFKKKKKIRQLSVYKTNVILLDFFFLLHNKNRLEKNSIAKVMRKFGFFFFRFLRTTIEVFERRRSCTLCSRQMAARERISCRQTRFRQNSRFTDVDTETVRSIELRRKKLLKL